MSKVTVPGAAERERCDIDWGKFKTFPMVGVHELQIEGLRLDLECSPGLVDLNHTKQLAKYLHRLGYRRIVEARES